MQTVIVFALLAFAGLLVWKAGFDAGKRSEQQQQPDAEWGSAPDPSVIPIRRYTIGLTSQPALYVTTSQDSGRPMRRPKEPA